MVGLVQVAVPNHLGDAVMALPALRRLVAGLPGAEVLLVGRPLAASVLDGQGPWPVVAPAFSTRPGSAAVLLAPSLRVAIAAWRDARASRRIGTPTDFRRLLLTHVVKVDPLRAHQREVYLRVVDAALGLLGGEAPAGDDDRFDADLEAGRVAWERAGRPRFLLHPWAQGSGAKRWPASRWLALGRALGDVVVTGGPGEEDARTARELAGDLGAPCAAGAETLAPAAWAGLARLVDRAILPDTGPAHLASAAGAIPLVLFGATDPARFAPARAVVVRGASMQAIEVGRVLDACAVGGQ